MSIFDHIRKDGKPLIEDDKIDVTGIKLVTGKVTKVDSKGYGFISSKEVPFERIFFHWTSLRHDTTNFKHLIKGAKVEFLPIKNDDGTYRAIKIRVITNGVVR